MNVRGRETSHLDQLSNKILRVRKFNFFHVTLNLWYPSHEESAVSFKNIFPFLWENASQMLIPFPSTFQAPSVW